VEDGVSKTKKITLNIPISIDLTESFLQGMDDFVAQYLQDLLDNVLEEGHTDKEIAACKVLLDYIRD
jgi:hypothetical protein